MDSSLAGIPLSRSRKKLKLSPRSTKPPPPPQTKWRTSAQERIYGRRLLEALRSARNNGNTDDPSSHPDNPTVVVPPPFKPPAPWAIKEAADSALALTARGQSRWSRAILSRRWHMRKLLLKAGGKIRGRKKGSAIEAAARVAKRWKKGEGRQHAGVLKGKKVRDRLRLLARLVPGCRKVSTPNLLEETADYVAALEMQVKTMRYLAADALSSASASAAAHSSLSSSSSDAAPASRPLPPPPRRQS